MKTKLRVDVQQKVPKEIKEREISRGQRRGRKEQLRRRGPTLVIGFVESRLGQFHVLYCTSSRIDKIK